jgi:Asp-tRNA(Asn)/Glu-tRNA(Gln) amidotransferase A subunit family amidase
MSVPAIRGPHGMPVGVQVIAKRYSDRALLDVARWLVLNAGIDGQKGIADIPDAELTDN